MSSALRELFPFEGTEWSKRTCYLILNRASGNILYTGKVYENRSVLRMRSPLHSMGEDNYPLMVMVLG